MYEPRELWAFLLPGYFTTVAVELVVLMPGLSRVHSRTRKFLAGLWMTACTYPIVILVLPLVFDSRVAYLAVAETFAPVAECLVFALAFHDEKTPRSVRVRDYIAITVANLASFGFGLLKDAWS